MAIFSALFNNNTDSFQQAFNVKDITSAEMMQAIKECFNLYFSAENLPNEDDCQRLPVIVVNKLTKTAFSEYSANADGEFAQGILKALDTIKRKAMQYMLVGGECLIKPVPYGDRFYFLPVRRDCFISLGRDEEGKLTSIGMAEFSSVNGEYYTLLEKRTAGEKLIIENKLFMSEIAGTLGREVPLASLHKYKQLQPVITLPIKGTGLVELKTPLLNDVDGSDEGVPVFEPAAKLIRNINRNEYQLDREFENGRSRIVASADMFRKNGNGQKELKDDVFVALDEDPENVGITIFSPELREQSYLNRKNEYLRNIESLIGLKRGILSEVEAAERTATEVTSSEGDYQLSIIDFQEKWENALKEIVVLCSELGKIYRVKGAVDIDPEKISIDWGDGVLYNRDKVNQEMLVQVQSGLLAPEIYLGWYYEMPYETPGDRAKIREKYMPEIEQLTEGE